MNETGKKTRLHDWHVRQGANMARFGQYDMPLWYRAGAKSEHLAVITASGLFDTSHMSGVMVKGAEARGLLQHCFSQDLERCIGKQQGPLVAGRSVYGVFLAENGNVIDDAIVFQLDARLYLVVVNSGMGPEISAHLRSHGDSGGAEISDLSDALGKFDVQGPAAARILARVLAEPDRVLDDLPYFSFKGHFDASSELSEAVKLLDGTPLLLSRTGYTGEFGFEIFVQPEQFVSVWERILAAGQDHDLLPCGLAARDSLRAGAVLPLSHQDIGPWKFINHPWEFALPFNADRSGFTKDFVGADALLHTEGEMHTYPYAGADLRKVTAGDSSAVLNQSGDPIGKVLTCATDMAIGRHDGRIFSIASTDKPPGFAPRGLCCGFVKVNRQLQPGTAVRLKDSRRSIEVQIVTDIRPARTARKKISELIT
jgi:aminomethyltransferase